MGFDLFDRRKFTVPAELVRLGFKLRIPIYAGRVFKACTAYKKGFDPLKPLTPLYLLIKKEKRRALAERIFLRCGFSPDGVKSERLSLERDAELIYAAFMAEYGLDLRRNKRLTWDEFAALFRGLSDNTRIKKIMSAREAVIPENDTGEYSRRLARLKAFYAVDNDGRSFFDDLRRDCGE